MKREMWLECFLRAALENEGLSGQCRPQVFRVERTLSVEHLSVTHFDRGAGRSARREANESDHVLAKVHDPDVAAARDFFRLQFQQLAHGRTPLWIERKFVFL